MNEKPVLKQIKIIGIAGAIAIFCSLAVAAENDLILQNSGDKIIPGRLLSPSLQNKYLEINKAAQQYEQQQQQQGQQQQQEQPVGNINLAPLLSEVNPNTPDWEIGSSLPSFMQTEVVNWLTSSNNPEYKPLCQGMFGACATFATDGALGYEEAGSVRTISPIETLDILQRENKPNERGAFDAGTSAWTTGWEGASSEDILNTYINTYIPKYSLADETEYADLSKEDLAANNSIYNSNGTPSNATILSPGSSFKVYSDMADQYSLFKYGSNEFTPPSNVQVNIFQPKDSSFINLRSIGDQNFNNNTNFIKAALDNGQIVLIGFACASQIDQVGFPTNYYSFNPSDDSLIQGTATSLGPLTQDSKIESIVDSKMTQEIAPGTSPYKADAWTNLVNSSSPAAGHEVFIVGYFVNKNASQEDINNNQNIIFVVRNSWGLFGGDNGNFYMSGGFVDQFVDDCLALGSTNFIKDGVDPTQPTQYESIGIII